MLSVLNVRSALPFSVPSTSYFFIRLCRGVYETVYKAVNERPQTCVLFTANIITALLFAVGHLPVTATTQGLYPMIVFRCFLLNGGCGLLFGWLYRKYGLRYSMIAHVGCHIVSKLIWIIFI